MVTYKREFQRINKILKEWNPIGVPEPALSDEYTSYIPQILEKKNDEKKLLEYLEDLLVNVIGVEYNPNKKQHKQDVLKVIEKIRNL